MGSAGFSFNDPVFGSRIWRVTDGHTRTDAPDWSFRTPSGTHQNEWSASGSYFYVVSNGGTMIPFAFEAGTGAFRRLDTLRFYIEPQFSYVHDGLIYGSLTGAGASLRTIDQFDFASGTYAQLLDLDTLAGGLKGTYVGGIASSSGATERILALFGGIAQDHHRYVVVFDHDRPSQRRLLDSVASTVDGRAASTTLDFHLHHAAIDRSGRYVMLYPTSVDLAAPRRAAQVYVWDTQTDAITALPATTAHSGGHDAYGYGVGVNKDCCTTTAWDSAQWQRRLLSDPLISRDLISPILTPKEVAMSDHPSWNNARPDVLEPFITATYRYGTDAVEWRPWDDEILAMQTDVGDGSSEVWRLAQHRSDVHNDTDPQATSFWYTPRPNVSPDGRWVLFTSNWEKTLGTDPSGVAGEKARQDVFLLQLRPLGNVVEASPSETGFEITVTSLPDGVVGQRYVGTLLASRPATWRVSAGRLPPGLVLDDTGRITGTPRNAGFWTIKVTATAQGLSDSRSYLISVK